ALPHGIAGERQVKTGDFITMDFGCNCGGYWSDVTRTVCLGSATEKQREIYEVVKSAQDKAIVAVKAGKTGTEIDRVARDIISNAGYSDYFGHGLGHSFGLDIHENPRCAPSSEGEAPLQSNMIITIEPGIYIPNWGGVRIEDDLIVTADGSIDLTKASKELIEL
ncbi:MAG: M24 family metallopeptidase, partial [Oscillospiraceae bacterium]